MDKVLECLVREDKAAEVQGQVIMVVVLLALHTVLVQILTDMVVVEQVCKGFKYLFVDRIFLNLYELERHIVVDFLEIN